MGNRVFSAVILLIAMSAFGSQNNSKLLNSDTYTYETTKISSFDGALLEADLFLPNPQSFPGLRPTIVFASSWALGDFEYFVQAIHFVEKGYIVLSYAPRGFGGSEGLVSVAGPNDIKDISSVIDWLLGNHPVDETKIGMAGVSYGAGIALLGAALDDRIDAAVALSGWSDLYESLFSGETQKKVWTDLLLISGQVTGHMDPTIEQMYENLINYENIEETISWALERSAITYIDKINQRKIPILLANSYRDHLFPPNQYLPFFQKLEGPKKLVMSPGTHFTAELSGLLGVENEIWDETNDWFDYWLQDDQSKKPEELPVVYRSDNDRIALSEFDTLNGVDIPLDAHLGLFDDDERVLIHSNHDSGASTGIPLISDVFERIDIKITMSGLNRNFGMVYYSDRLNTSKLRGIPSLEFWIEPNNENIQLIAYFYRVNPLGIGTYLTHGAITLRDLPVGIPHKVKMDALALAEDVPWGQKISVVIDTSDAIYGKPNNENYSFYMLNDDDRRLKLNLPIVD